MQEVATGIQTMRAYGWMSAEQLRAAARIQAGISACCREPLLVGQSAVLTQTHSSQI